MRNRRVLVAGGSGFVGLAFVKHLLDVTDWDVVVIGRRPWDWDFWDARMERITSVRCNLATSTAHWLKITIGEVDAIVNFAASTDVQTTLKDPIWTHQNTVQSTQTLLEYARGLPNLTHFVQISSGEVYGPITRGGPPTREHSRINPVTPYSAAKASQEALCAAYWHSYGVPVVITNTNHLFGEGQPSDRFIPTAVRKLIAGEPIPIIGGRGVDGTWQSASRGWLHVQSHSEAVKWLLDQPISLPNQAILPQKFNITGPELEVLEVAEKLARSLNLAMKVARLDQHGARAGHEMRYMLDTNKLFGAGWRPSEGFHTLLERTARDLATSQGFLIPPSDKVSQ